MAIPNVDHYSFNPLQILQNPAFQADVVKVMNIAKNILLCMTVVVPLALGIYECLRDYDVQVLHGEGLDLPLGARICFVATILIPLVIGCIELFQDHFTFNLENLSVEDAKSLDWNQLPHDQKWILASRQDIIQDLDNAALLKLFADPTLKNDALFELCTEEQRLIILHELLKLPEKESRAMVQKFDVEPFLQLLESMDTVGAHAKEVIYRLLSDKQIQTILKSEELDVPVIINFLGLVRAKDLIVSAEVNRIALISMLSDEQVQYCVKHLMKKEITHLVTDFAASQLAELLAALRPAPRQQIFSLLISEHKKDLFFKYVNSTEFIEALSSDEIEKFKGVYKKFLDEDPEAALKLENILKK